MAVNNAYSLWRGTSANTVFAQKPVLTSVDNKVLRNRPPHPSPTKNQITPTTTNTAITAAATFP